MGNEVNVEFIKAMQIIADRKFGNGDKELKAEEKEAIRFFEEKMEEAFLDEKTINAETFNQAMGLYKSAPAATTEADVNPEEVAKEEKVETKADKKADKKAKKEFVDKDENERKENYIFRQLDNLVAGASVTRATLLSEIDDKIGAQKDDPKYTEIRVAIKDVLDVMPKKYTTLKDIERQHDQIVEKLNYDGIEDDLHLEILNKLEKIAEVEVRLAASENIKTRFNKAYTVKEDEDQKTSEQAMNAVKDDLKAKKQYKDETKDAYKDFEKTTIQRMARGYVEKAIKDVENLTDRKDVVEKAKELLIERGQWDEYTEKALSQKGFNHAITGKDSFGRTKAKTQAIGNNVEKMKHQTKENVLDTLGKKNEVYEALVSSGLITVDGNNVDLSLLSDIIGVQVGADHVLNRHAEIDKAISERFRLNSALALKANLEDMTEKEAKKLAKLTGYKLEGKDIRKILINAVEGFTAGAGIGGAAAAMTPRQSVLVKGDIVNHNLNLTFDGISKDALGNLPAGVDVTETGAGIVINISQVVQQPDRLVKLSKMIGPIAWKSGVMGAALGALEGLKDTGEEPVTVTNFTETNFEDYVERMQWELEKLGKAELIPGFTCLASSFLKTETDKDGNEVTSWDKAGYLAKLNELAADGGKLNIAEAPTYCPDEKKEDNCDTDDINCNVAVNQEDPTIKNNITDNTYTHHRNAGDSWAGLVKAYYPELEAKCGGLYGKNGAIKALQRELATDDKGNFDNAKFVKIITATDLPKEIKMPSKVMGVNRVIGDVDPATIKPNNGEYIKPLDKVGRDEISSVKETIPGVFVATDGCTNITASGSTAEEAVKNLETQTGKKYNNRSEYIKE